MGGAAALPDDRACGGHWQAQRQIAPLNAAAADPAAATPRMPCPVCGGRAFDALFERQAQAFVRCRECTLTLINPQPSLAAIAAGYDADYSAGYMRKAEKKLRRARRRVARIRRRHVAEGRWLDVGCSAGFVVRAAADAGYEAHGCDIEAAGIRYGRDELGLDGLRLGLVHEQAWPDHWFNVISAYDVIEHVPDLNAFVAELKRLLHPDGVIDIGTPDIGHWRVPAPLSTWNEIKPGEHLYYFDRHTLGRLLARHELRVVAVRLALKPGLKLLAAHAR